jgi:hypothetical protein
MHYTKKGASFDNFSYYPTKGLSIKEYKNALAANRENIVQNVAREKIQFEPNLGCVLLY